MIQFTDAMLVGNGQIDTEHKMLIDLINNAYEQIEKEHCTIENAMELIHHLENYADTHFAHEEKYMQSIDDPEYTIQKHEHDVFRAKISEYKGIDVNNREEAELILEDVLTYLAQWLYRHILSSDILIGKVPVLSKEEINEVFVFSSKFHSGIEFIDEEHKGLFELIEKSYNTLHNDSFENDLDRFDAVMSVLDELDSYTRSHFKHEEEYMERIGFSGLEEQVKAHDAFIYKLEDVNAEIGHEDANEYLEDLVEYLLFWLTNHILKKDMLIPYVPEEDYK